MGTGEKQTGKIVELNLSTPNGYDVTVQAALGLMEKMLSGSVEPGSRTPALVMGSDYITRLLGVALNG